MWREKSQVHSNYTKVVGRTAISEKYQPIRINGISKFTETRRMHALWEEVEATKRPKRGIFGVSLLGIRAERKELSVNPQLLESNVFYLFSYENERYIARKNDDSVVEIFEVIE